MTKPPSSKVPGIPGSKVPEPPRDRLVSHKQYFWESSIRRLKLLASEDQTATVSSLARAALDRGLGLLEAGR